MSQGMDGHACFADLGAPCGGAEGALDAGATHGRGRRSAVFLIAPGSGKSQGLCRWVFQEARNTAESLQAGARSGPVAPLPRWTWTSMRCESISAG